MKRLGKKVGAKLNTIEAYNSCHCNCASCNCSSNPQNYSGMFSMGLQVMTGGSYSK